jgi:DNA-binding transcriptional LysR family regulator
MINLTQLKLFRDIARELSFVRVAQQNHISQPAVSVHIKKLEHELGKKLLTRTPHNIQLTPEGMVILADVKKILSLCDNLKIRSNYQQGTLEGNIRIASIHSFGMYEIGDFLSSFMRSNPKVHVHLEFRRSDEIYSLLLTERIDIGVVAYPENRTRIETLPLGQDELVLIVDKSHPLWGKNSIKLEQINNEPFVAFEEGIPTREAIDKMLEQKGIVVDIRMTNDNIYTLKKAVSAGIGVSIVPVSAVDEEVLNGHLSRVKIRDIDLYRPLSLLKLKKNTLNPPTEAFVEQLLKFHV